jgi:hypothetical protein
MCMWRHRRITLCGEKMTHLLDLGGLIASVEEDDGK